MIASFGVHDEEETGKDGAESRQDGNIITILFAGSKQRPHPGRTKIQKQEDAALKGGAT